MKIDLWKIWIMSWLILVPLIFLVVAIIFNYIPYYVAFVIVGLVSIGAYFYAIAE